MKRSSRRKEAPISFIRNRMSLLTSAATEFKVRGRCGRRPCAIRFMESPDAVLACIGTMNPGVAASWQSAAIRGNNSQRRSAETPLRGDSFMEREHLQKIGRELKP